MKSSIYTIAALTTVGSAQYGAQYQPQTYQQYHPTMQQNKSSPAEAVA